MKLIHISDLHIGGGDAQLHGLEMLVKHLLTNPVENASIIISGDIVDGRNGSEWVIASKVLKRLLERYQIILATEGNHDTSSNRGITYDDKAAQLATNNINALTKIKAGRNGIRVLDIDGIRIIGLNSCIGNEDDFFPPMARGELGISQLVELEILLQDSIPTFIVMHHKPLATDVMHTLEDREDFLALIKRREHVRAVMFGHMHLWSVKDVGHIRFFESDNTTISRQYRIIDTDTLKHQVVKF